MKYIFCDIRNKKRLKDKLNNYYDYIVNFSGYVDHSKNKSITKIHFQGCKNLVSNFQNNKPRKFIQIGSSIEYGKRKSPKKEISIRKIDTLSVYGNAKLKSTLFFYYLSSKNKVFHPQFYDFIWFMIPNQDNNRLIPYVISNSLKGKKFNCSPGNQFRDFTYIKDVITAIYKTIKSKKSNGEVINIGFGRPIKIKDAIQKIVKYVGKGEPIFSKLKIRNDEPLKLYPNINKAKKFLIGRQK